VARVDVATFGPTSWDLRPDVQEVAQEVVRKFGGTWNTYIPHPPGTNLAKVSVDFWDNGGRGDKLPRKKRRQITRYLRYRSGQPKFRWIINGSRRYWPSGFRDHSIGGLLWNAGHVHVTYE